MSKETVKVIPYHDKTRTLTVEISVAELEALGFTRTVVKPWKPVDGEACWYNSINDIYGTTWDSDNYDESCWNLGNCYQTKAEATKARDKQLATVRVLRRLRELEGGWVADWSDWEQSKYYLYYDYIDGILRTSATYHTVYCQKEWYSTEAAWEQVIKELEQDVKCMMGVE